MLEADRRPYSVFVGTESDGRVAHQASCVGRGDMSDRIRVPAISLLFGVVFFLAAEGGEARKAAALRDTGHEVSAVGDELPDDLPIHLTDEEKSRLDEIGMYHIATSPPSGFGQAPEF